MARAVSALGRSLLRGERDVDSLDEVRGPESDESRIAGRATDRDDAEEGGDGARDDTAVDGNVDTSGDVPDGTGGDEEERDAALDSLTPEDVKESPTVNRRQVAVFASVAALLIGTVAAGAGAGWFLVQHRDANQARDRDKSVMDTAGRVAADLVTLRAGSADDDIKKIQESSTGEFRQQIGDSTSSFAAVLRQGEVDSTGKASQLAIEESGDDQSVVLAAVTSTLKNSESPEAQQRVYRMRVTLDRSGSNWLVSKVEFVA
ncbi:hypothetical protein [Tsukamurella paurometabola]|uniref:Mce-associated membrane protein n=1 Tax=Tsukamurella paurometabola TaxID=2061 RepID=A0ABS5NFE7_TSUPA|nr:hypothetical protein [Tsukamurella paurometabola]MBS4102992.1 hypothetical protein [Tsukamurella paurometabola]